jgi:translation initiation factor IF-2
MTKENQKFKKVKLFQAARELNVTADTLIDHLKKHGYKDALAGSGLNASITNEDAYVSLLEAFASDKAAASRIKDKRAAHRAETLEVVAAPIEAPVLHETGTDSLSSSEEAPEVELPLVSERVEAVDERATASPAEQADDTDASAEELQRHEESDGYAEAEDSTLTAEAAQEAEIVTASTGDTSDLELDRIEETPAEEEPSSVEESAQPVLAEAVNEDVGAEVDADIEDQVEEVSGDQVEEATEEDTPSITITADRYRLAGTKIIGKIDLQTVDNATPDSKRKRKRKRKDRQAPQETKPAVEAKRPIAEESEADKKKRAKRKRGPAVDEAAVQQTLQDTLRELEQGASRARQRRRRQRRDERAAERERGLELERAQEGILRVTEFVSTGELANLLGVSVTEVISTLFKSGMMVSINQRLDADTISFLAAEYGFDVDSVRKTFSSKRINPKTSPRARLSSR